MTTIYKTTERGGKRAVSAFPTNDLLSTYNWLCRIMGELGWDFTLDGDGIHVKFHKGDTQATYTAIVENSLSLQSEEHYGQSIK